MNIENKITITLKERDVKEIVAEYLTGKGYKVSPDNVTLSVGTRTQGYGPGEYEEVYFKECVAVVKNV